ncbi:hypothetical protein A0H81_12381 [Grifola frondosa]|uniref:Uncharacterized protein n=1 Tax=Grifola frondosa TaxID=5627 RepID=A0A1C7LSP0_GRIFR|nr:hypothetical protein A0H81_12381 [Grifola frondosa]
MPASDAVQHSQWGACGLNAFNRVFQSFPIPASQVVVLDLPIFPFNSYLFRGLDGVSEKNSKSHGTPELSLPIAGRSGSSTCTIAALYVDTTQHHGRDGIEASLPTSTRPS